MKHLLVVASVAAFIAPKSSLYSVGIGYKF